MYLLLLVIHVLACFVLIFVVLLQAGRGGGMSEMIGGGQPSTLFGTQTNEFMTRATEVCATIFIITSLALGILSAQRGKSLMEKHRVAAPAAPVSAPVTPAAAPAVPVATAAAPAPVAAPAASAAPATPAPAASSQTAETKA